MQALRRIGSRRGPKRAETPSSQPESKPSPTPGSGSRANPFRRILEIIKGKKEPAVLDVGISRLEPRDGLTLVEKYPVTEPYAQVFVYQDPDIGAGYRYFVDEVRLSENETVVHQKLMKIVSKELEPPTNIETDPADYAKEQAQRLLEKYKKSLGELSPSSWDKVLYYLVRDMAGYGSLDALFRDPRIEDISCNGIHKPIFIWHSKYESIPTNISFVDEQTYNDFIIKLAHKGSKHISSSHPILDASLPEKHRLAATFQKEVSTHGSSFCIRKFREDPISVVDQLGFGTMPSKLAAYYWMLLEYRQNFLILGGTGAGKTSMLNALLSLVPPNDKIITVEEVAELNPPHENWVQLVSRKGFVFGQTAGASIDLFDLVKLSLRYRPDYIVVGEVRGEEAFTLFQAIATGHGGICTMHSDNLDHAVKRLTSEPMNIAKIYIPLMNVAMYISRVELPTEVHGLKFGRRIRNVWEIDDYDNYIEISRWDPSTDTFDIDLQKSIRLRHIANVKGVDVSNIVAEIERRARLLNGLQMRGIRDQREVALRIQEYLERGSPELEVELPEEAEEAQDQDPSRRVGRRFARVRRFKSGE